MRFLHKNAFWGEWYTEYCKNIGPKNGSMVFLSCSQSAREKWYFYLKTYFAAVLLVPSSSSAQISADSLKSNGTQETLMFVRTRDNNMRSQLDFTGISIWQSIIFTTSNKPVLQRRFALHLSNAVFPEHFSWWSRLKWTRRKWVHPYSCICAASAATSWCVFLRWHGDV